MTYARARLWLGISGVGTSVLVASAVLFFDVPSRTLSTSATQSLLEALTSLAMVLVLGVAVLFPFDVVGGAILVRARTRVSLFVARWLRGASVQFAVWMASAFALMTAARAGGAIAAIVCFVALQSVLALLRAPMARLIASFTVVRTPERLREAATLAGLTADRITVLESADEGFVGGWSGFTPGRLIMPSRWLELPDDALVAALLRRRVTAESGAHLRGVLAAIAWNTLGFVLVLSRFDANLATAAGLLTMAAGMTMWAFAGVLLLPTPSRVAVIAVDAASARHVAHAVVLDAIERLDRWQDDEPARPAGVEAVFHPVPSRTARAARVEATQREPAEFSDVRRWHAHHVARHALWLGWATMSPISRAVHCNVGRTALWAMLPGD